MSELQFVDKVGCEVINVAASDDMVAMAAWVSNDQDSAERLAERDRKAKLISFLYKNKHMSPFEHGLFTFKVDVPLFVAREFHRHRTASYNEVSGRYTEMKPRFWMGDVARVQQGKMGNYFFVEGSEDQTEVYTSTKRKAAKKAWKVYRARLEAGIAKEQAREDLPLSLMTQFYVTMNPRNLMQFLTLRNDTHALKEIREIAVEMEKALEQYMPITYGVYTAERGKTVNQTSLESDIIKIKELEAKVLRLELELALAKTPNRPYYHRPIPQQPYVTYNNDFNPQVLAGVGYRSEEEINRLNALVDYEVEGIEEVSEDVKDVADVSTRTPVTSLGVPLADANMIDVNTAPNYTVNVDAAKVNIDEISDRVVKAIYETRKRNERKRR